MGNYLATLHWAGGSDCTRSFPRRCHDLQMLYVVCQGELLGNMWSTVPRGRDQICLVGAGLAVLCQNMLALPEGDTWGRGVIYRLLSSIKPGGAPHMRLHKSFNAPRSPHSGRKTVAHCVSGGGRNCVNPPKPRRGERACHHR